MIVVVLGAVTVGMGVGMSILLVKYKRAKLEKEEASLKLGRATSSCEIKNSELRFQNM